jgi:FtsZ-interacting cell division protein ZipA
VKAILIIIIVVGVLIGGLLTLRATRGAGMPSQDVMERAQKRARDQAAKDDQDGG